MSWTTTNFRSPEGLRGEAMGVLLVTHSAGLAAGALNAGSFFDMFGVQDSLIGTGILLTAFGVAPTMLVGRQVRDPA